MSPASLVSIHRYPVKGFSAETLADVELEAGRFFPGDRLYAVENGPSGFDPDAPAYKDKTSFLVLMRNARIAALKTHLDPDSHVFSLNGPDGVVTGDLRTAEGRATVETFLTAFMGEAARGPLKVLTAPEGHRFTDSLRSGFVSLVNLASVRDLEARMGAPVDPIRFRMNLHLDGWAPGAELDLVGRTLAIGPVRLKVLKRTERCAATSVNPDTAERDLNVVKGLHTAYGHTDCGVYAKVLTGGRIAPGDAVTLEA
ncbi:MOSC domain-containing protein [Aquabacter sp. L1I39]|uniref:MOSC domain-containing protein n=1 Tax=Aquabacter sp. L1I39 TaxID=2820278 RepID=UPI001ADC7FD0|nr:MOSC domain-containing protein [Aquabacter sp. L1I39]QTL01795.1 MOSC domain-containing protein [Aquabacter sp. L1I39]